jgi:DnaK suppressor protein
VVTVMELTAEQLRQRREALLARARELGREVRDTVKDRNRMAAATREEVADLGDQGEALRHDIVLSAEEDRDAGELAEVDAALARIETGRYGECIDCGIDIPPARLQAQPAAARCIECQRNHETASTVGGGVAS